jgi:hypothetical protein
MSTWLIPRLQDMLFIALFLAVIMIGPRMLNIDGDLGRHLTIGEHILATLSIPTRDLFSYTMAGEALTPHEWLAQLIFAISNRLIGLDGVVILCALLIATTFTILFRQCNRRSGMPLVGLGFSILAAATASLHWLARPHLFTLRLVVLWIGELEGLRQNTHHRWWTLPLLMLVWVNVHGAFIAGFAIWGIYLVGMSVERWARTGLMDDGWKDNSNLNLVVAAGSLSFLVSLINPVGWRLWETTLGFLNNKYLVSHTVEYLPPNFHAASTWPFLVMILLSIILLGLNLTRRSFVAILLVVFWTGMGLISARNIPLYALVVAPILAVELANLIRTSRRLEGAIHLDDRIAEIEMSLHGFVWSLLVVGLIVLFFYRNIGLNSSESRNSFSPQVFPVQAVDWIEAEQISGPGFNYFPWGGYVLFRAWPEQQVFIDGQTDFYGENLTRQYETVLTLGDGWRQILDKYEVSWVLLPEDAQLVNALKAEAGWEVGYQDSTAVVLVYEP